MVFVKEWALRMEENYLPAEEQEAEKNLPYQTKNVSNSTLSWLKGFGFGKPEKLKKKTVIDDIFLKGKAIQKNGFAFLYLEQVNAANVPVQAMFAVSKKNFKHATNRNKIKRLMREVWRLEKAKVYLPVLQAQKQFAVCIMFKGRTMPNFKQVKENLQLLFLQFCKQIKAPH